MRRLLTIGTFDVPHAGHAAFLRRCEGFADEVIVGVNTDDFVAQFKRQPTLYSAAERMALVAELGYRVVRNRDAGRRLIDRIRPDVLAIGSDWARRDYYAQIDVTQDFLDERNITMVYIPYTAGISTTDIRRRFDG